MRLLGAWDLPGHCGPIYALACDYARGVLFSGGSDGIVAEWRCISGKQAQAVAHTPGAIYALHWVPQAQHLYLGHSSGTVYVIDLAGKKLRRAIKAHQGAVFGLSSHPTDWEGWSSGREGHFLFWDLEKSEPYAAVPVTPAGLRGFTLAQERNAFLLAGRDGYLYEVNRAKRAVSQAIAADPEVLFSVAVSPQGRWIATGGKRGILKLWNASLQLVWEASAHTYAINALAWHPEGRLLATGSRDRLIHLWDIETREKKLTLPGHQRSVNTLVWISPEVLASAGDDGLIKMWHLEV